jgi:hypothetical protein
MRETGKGETKQEDQREGTNILFHYPSSHLKMLPFVFYALHKLLEALLAADVG